MRDSVRPDSYEKLRPNVRAIVALCEPRGVEPEALFASAEKQDPSGDLILVLHAKYVWKRDHERATPLWEKVLKLARNASLRSMAERYLAGEVKTDEMLHLSALTWQGKFKLGGGFESNPGLPLAPEPAVRRAQAFSAARLQGGAQRWYPFGSISFNYEGSYNRYLANPELSLLANEAEFPVSLRLGSFEDLIFRPFYGISHAGPRHFGNRYGLGVMGVAYRPDYKQSVQGSVFTERLLFPEFKPEEGTHFRFDYDWDFFPSLWSYRFQASMEHVRAVNDFKNGTNLKFSHTDVGAGVRVKCIQPGITYDAELQATMRLDSLDSEYASRKSGGRARKRRNDLTLNFKPSVSVPLGEDLSLGGVYELAKTFSPLGPNDYADYNRFDHTLGVLFATEFTNY